MFLYFQVQHNDDLGCNVCKICSENIMKFYDFLLMYKASDKKLREMLNNVRLDLDTDGEHKPNIIELEENSRVTNVNLESNNQEVTTSRLDFRRKQRSNGFIDVRDLPEQQKYLSVTPESTIRLDCAMVIQAPIPFSHYEDSNNSVQIHNIKTENLMDDEVVDTKQFIPTAPTTDPIEVKWKCRKCLLEFKTRQLLSSHNKMHLIKKSKVGITEECTNSLDTASTNELVKRHRREKHLQEPKVRKSNKDMQERCDKVYICDFCHKTFNSKNKIKQHVITHINEGRRKFLCVACGFQFCSKFGLGQHIRAIHEKEQRFQCNICQRRFAHKHNLKTHMNRHEGVRPYPCSLCKKAFYDSSTLNVHTKSVHSNSNSYICNICLKSFNRNGNLKIHMVKTHNLQPPKPQGNIKRVIVSLPK